jgi:hypothetical protein
LDGGTLKTCVVAVAVWSGGYAQNRVVGGVASFRQQPLKR